MHYKKIKDIEKSTIVQEDIQHLLEIREGKIKKSKEALDTFCKNKLGIEIDKKITVEKLLIETIFPEVKKIAKDIEVPEIKPKEKKEKYIDVAEQLEAEIVQYEPKKEDRDPFNKFISIKRVKLPEKDIYVKNFKTGLIFKWHKLMFKNEDLALCNKKGELI